MTSVILTSFVVEKQELKFYSANVGAWLISLSHELNEESHKILTHDFSRVLADKFGLITDYAIHQPTDKEVSSGADLRNFHAHILLTTRKAELDASGMVTLTTK